MGFIKNADVAECRLEILSLRLRKLKDLVDAAADGDERAREYVNAFIFGDDVVIRGGARMCPCENCKGAK